MNKLFPAALATATLALAGCGSGSDNAAQSAPETTQEVLSVNETCDQLFDKGDEGRMFSAVTFLANVPEPVTETEQIKAKNLASGLESVAETANDEMKTLINDMARTLNDFASAEGTKINVNVDSFKAAGSKIIDLCPDQAEAYGDEKMKKEAKAKAAADAAAKKAADEAAAKAAAEAAAAPKEYAGVGDDIVTITKHDSGPQVAVITHTGGSNFAVHTLDAALANNDLLVNEIGNYKGTVLFDVMERDQTTALKITAGGSWTVTFVPLSSVRSFDGTAPMTGTGADVFRYTGAAKPATFVHDGSSNIAVHHYSTRRNLLVNEIGAYTGTVAWAPGLYTVTADGNWSATLK